VEAYQDTSLCSRGRGIDKQILAMILFPSINTFAKICDLVGLLS